MPLLVPFQLVTAVYTYKMGRELVRVAVHQSVAMRPRTRRHLSVPILGSEEGLGELGLLFFVLFATGPAGRRVFLLPASDVSCFESSTILEETLGRRQRHEVPLAN